MAALRSELDGLRMMALHRRAQTEGVPVLSIEEAMETDAPKAQLIALVLAQAAEQTQTQVPEGIPPARAPAPAPAPAPALERKTMPEPEPEPAPAAAPKRFMLMLTQSDLVGENSLLRTSASSLEELIANVAETLGIAASAAHVLCELDGAGRSGAPLTSLEGLPAKARVSLWSSRDAARAGAA